MRILALVLVLLIAAIQTPLWFGKGGWLRVWELDRQLEAQRTGNEQLRVRNAALDAEVRDLRTGYDAIEERARSELGMIRQDEVFFPVLSKCWRWDRRRLGQQARRFEPGPRSWLRARAQRRAPRPDRSAQDGVPRSTGSTSVSGKSSPLNSRGSPSAFANA
jgi:cell division protein FtsB